MPTFASFFFRLRDHACGLLAIFLLGGCSSPPKGIEPVGGFQADRYLGMWYEIARLDHSFERGLSRVTAEYSRRADGGIDVVNRGYDAKRGDWKEARGVARFVGTSDVASLKVTFFWPFSGGYHVIALGSDYEYAMVTSSSRSYLWILARHRKLDTPVLEELLTRARGWGFRTEDLIFVEQ